MVKFDRLKLRVDVDSVIVKNEEIFQHIVENGKLCELRYHQRSPFQLGLKLDYLKNEAIIEFSGKVLGKDYPQLISSVTIMECFEHIAQLGFCEFDMSCLESAMVLSCDVTNDVEVSDINAMTKYIRGHLKNYTQFTCSLLKNGNLIIEKNVTSTKCKRRMVIYDKSNEMLMSSNMRFAEQYDLLGAFDGKCRFEMNLRNMEAIRSTLGITDNSLRSVLSSDSTPLKDFLEDVMSVEPPIKCLDWKEYVRNLVLRDCNYDLAQVEAKVRSLYKRGTFITGVMKPYRAMMEERYGADLVFSLPDLLSKLS